MKSGNFEVRNTGIGIVGVVGIGSILFLSALSLDVFASDVVEKNDVLPRVQKEGWFESQYHKFRSYPHMDRAYRLMNKGEDKEAQKELLRYLELNPQDSKARTTLITVLYKTKSYNEVLKQSQIVLLKEPSNTAVQLYKALSCAELGNKAQAMIEYQSISANTKGNIEDRAFATSALAETYLAGHQYSEALKSMQFLEALNAPTFKKDMSFYNRRAMAYEGIGRFFDAEKAYQEALPLAAAKSDRVRILVAAAHNAKQQGETKRAEAYLQQASLLDTSAKPIEFVEQKTLSIAKPKAIKKDIPKKKSDQQIANEQWQSKNYQAVIQTYKTILKGHPNSEEQYIAYMGLGYAYTELKDKLSAIASFQQAVLVRNDARALIALSHAFSAQEKMQEALDYSERAVKQSLKGGKDALSQERLHAAYRQQGFIHAQSGRYAAALHAFELALATGKEEQYSAIHLDMGYVAFAQKNWQEAQKHFEYVLNHQPKSEVRESAQVELMLQVSQCYENLGQYDHAIQMLNPLRVDFSDESKNFVKPELKKQVYDTLAYLYIRRADYVQASRLWEKSFQQASDPWVKLQLVQSYRLSGALDRAAQALSELKNIEKTSPHLAGVYWDEFAELYEKQHDIPKAIYAWEDALRIKPTAERHYRIGLLYSLQAQRAKAIEHFESAVAADATVLAYKESLAYAYKADGRYSSAAQLFEKILVERPKQLKPNNRIEKDLAYTYMQGYQNKQSEYWFRRAIDLIDETPDSEAVWGTSDMSDEQNSDKKASVSEDIKPKLATEPVVPINNTLTKQEELDQLRSEVGQLKHRWSASLYDSYRSGKNTTATPTFSATSGGTAIPGQGGVELSYQPEDIGFRDGKTLNVVARGLWSHLPDSTRINKESLQAAVGLVYKPFKEHNASIGVDRLIKIGNESQNNWLIRAAYGSGIGLGLKRQHPWWYSAQYYVDGGYFVNHGGSRAAYAEMRQGITFNLSDKVLLTPHLVMDGRYQSPDASNSGYIEAGAGVSVKYRPEDSKYQPSSSAAELLVQYKHKIAPHQTGAWVLTGVINTGE